MMIKILSLFILLTLPASASAEGFSLETTYNNLIVFIPLLNIFFPFIGLCLFCYSFYKLYENSKMNSSNNLQYVGIFISVLLMSFEKTIKIFTYSVLTDDQNIHFIGYMKGNAQHDIFNTWEGATVLLVLTLLGIYAIGSGVYRIYAKMRDTEGFPPSSIAQIFAGTILIQAEYFGRLVINSIWG